MKNTVVETFPGDLQQLQVFIFDSIKLILNHNYIAAELQGYWTQEFQAPSEGFRRWLDSHISPDG